MDEKVIQFRVGVVIIAAALVTGILIFLFGEGVRGQYTVYLKYPEAPGVMVDTPVRKNGILIGRVSKVELVEDGVLLTARIDDDRQLNRGEIPRIGTASLLGDAVVDFVPGRQGASTEPVQEGDVLTNGVVQSNPLDAINMIVELEDDIQSAIASVDVAGRSITELSDNINQFMTGNEDQLQSILNKTEMSMDKFSATMTTMNDLLGDEELSRRLKSALEDLPEIFNEAKLTLQDTRKTMAGFENVSRRAEINLQNLEGFTAPLGESGERLVANMTRTLQNVEEISAALSRFSEALENGDGTLGKIVYDDELYERLNTAIASVQDVTQKLPRIVNDLGVFSDKIARDPRLLGIKGAMDQRPAGMGLKSSALPSENWPR